MTKRLFPMINLKRRILIAICALCLGSCGGGRSGTNSGEHFRVVLEFSDASIQGQITNLASGDTKEIDGASVEFEVFENSSPLYFEALVVTVGQEYLGYIDLGTPAEYSSTWKGVRVLLDPQDNFAILEIQDIDSADTKQSSVTESLPIADSATSKKPASRKPTVPTELTEENQGNSERLPNPAIEATGSVKPPLSSDSGSNTANVSNEPGENNSPAPTLTTPNKPRRPVVEDGIFTEY